MTEKLKSFLQNDRHFFGLLLIIVALASFFLGQASVAPDTASHSPNNILISQAKISGTRVVSTSTRVVEQTDAGELIVASKSGTKYHLAKCPGASQIKPENRIEFASVAAAAAAGYTPAANCPGLE